MHLGLALMGLERTRPFKKNKADDLISCNSIRGDFHYILSENGNYTSGMIGLRDRMEAVDSGHWLYNS